MNKELIKKYKKEFEHWLNGGAVWAQTEYQGTWYKYLPTTSSIWDFVCDVTIIKDDEYVEFRKALAEGKTIQEFIYNGWTDMYGEHFSGGKNKYRIAPEEPKFKVGDWITRLEDNCTKQIISISENYYDGGKFIFDKDRFTYTLWEPQPGEWCWYKHLLIKVISVDKRDDGIIRYVVSAPMYAEQYSGAISLEPFLGTLPSFIKDKQ